MMGGMEGMGWGMGAMAILWVLLAVLVLLAIAALIKYLRK